MRSADRLPYVPAERGRRPPCRVYAHAIAGISAELIEDLREGAIRQADSILDQVQLVFCSRSLHHEDVGHFFGDIDDGQVEENLM